MIEIGAFRMVRRSWFTRGAVALATLVFACAAATSAALTPSLAQDASPAEPPASEAMPAPPGGAQPDGGSSSPDRVPEADPGGDGAFEIDPETCPYDDAPLGLIV
jgi:hypothetical protein